MTRILRNSPIFALASVACGLNISRRNVLQNHLFGAIASSFPFAAETNAHELPTTPSTTNTPISAAESTGVLWRTETGVALPATPNSLSTIIKNEVLGALSKYSTGIICISERHDDYEHHKVQLKIMMTIKKVLKERVQKVDQKFSIGMEMFQRKHQPYLDKYIAAGSPSATGNDEYTLQDLERDTSWDTNWGYDILHYVPLLFFARESGIRLLGLHPSDALVSMVEEKGLAGVPASIIDGVCVKDKGHRADFEMQAAHRMSLADFGGCKEAMEMEIFRQYEVQCFREEYMAQSVAIQMAKQPDGWVAVLAGERHISGRVGLPFRTLIRVANLRNKQENAAKAAEDIANRGVFVIIPKTITFPMKAKEAPDMKFADYVWFVQRDPSTRFHEDEVNPAPARKMLSQSTA
mmetsp:Transcript_20123/g.29875  ORF Transcript_20123/g.29875 Transcript_20123/m.29875 type:complete len:408 (-) Transcript_20123:181-1404(-)